MNQTIASRFKEESHERNDILEAARECAALTKPATLPLDGQDPNQHLPHKYTNVGTTGVTTLAGKMLMAIYPPDRPFFTFDLDTEIRYDEEVDPQLILAIEDKLFIQELIIMRKLESTRVKIDKDRSGSNFRTAMLKTIEQLIITGDTLHRLNRDYTVTVFRRDNYTTRRDCEGRVLSHIVLECTDAFELDADDFEKAKLNRDDYAEKTRKDREVKVYTLIEWNPVEERWKLTQEINNNVIREWNETVSPYISTAFDLALGEHYGRGLIEHNLPDLRSLNALEEAAQDIIALASKQLGAIDRASAVRARDLNEKGSGEFIEGAIVREGKVQDVGILSFAQTTEFQLINAQIERITKRLGRTFLSEIETQPQGERVTAQQVSRIAGELQDALGGAFVPIAEQQQTPLIRRLIYQAQRDLSVVPISPDIHIDIKTGLAALKRELDAEKLLRVLTMINQLGPTAMQRINEAGLAQMFFRMVGVDPTTLVKSQEQVAREQQQALALAAQQAATEETVRVGGDVARANLLPTGSQ